MNQFHGFIFSIRPLNILCVSGFKHVTCNERLYLVNYFNTPNLLWYLGSQAYFSPLSSSLSRYVFVFIRFLLSYIETVLLRRVKRNSLVIYVELSNSG